MQLNAASIEHVNVLESLNEHQCLEYLHSGSLGRVAFTIGDELDIFPVNYACDGSIVVYRTAQGTRLERGPRERVAFEVDGWDPSQWMGWSVVLKGVALDVTSGMDPFSKALRERKVVPLAPGKRERWVAIYPAAITGRRFSVDPARSQPRRAVRPLGEVRTALRLSSARRPWPQGDTKMDDQAKSTRVLRAFFPSGGEVN